MDRRDLFKLTLGSAAAIALGATEAVAVNGSKTSSDKMLGRLKLLCLVEDGEVLLSLKS
jgi:hypothetical protein